MINNFRGEYAFLSNFYSCHIPIVCFDETIICQSLEHAFQANKTFDPIKRKQIATASSPSEAKKLGKNVQLRPDWEKNKVEIMERLINKKFSFVPLREKLLATGNEELVEGNTWHDNFWGDCYCPKCKNIKGQNHLGKLLMKKRKEIQEIDKIYNNF